MTELENYKKTILSWQKVTQAMSEKYLEEYKSEFGDKQRQKNKYEYYKGASNSYLNVLKLLVELVEKDGDSIKIDN